MRHPRDSASRNLWEARPSNRRRGASADIAAPAICLVLMLILGAWPNGFFETSRNWLFDSYQRLSPAHRPEPHTILIDIDPESIRRIGQWPWPRDRLARLVDMAREARVIGIDLLLSESDRSSPENWVVDHPAIGPEVRDALLRLPSADDVLAQTIGRSAVVLAAVAVPLTAPQPPSTVSASPVREIGDDPRISLRRYGAVIRPLPKLAEAARGLGVVTMPPEADGVLRRVPAIVAVGNELAPSFVVEILRHWVAADSVVARGDASGLAEVIVGDVRLRTDPYGRVWPRYSAEAAARYLSAYSVLQGNVDPALFRDRIVLIGVSAPGLGDVIVSPLRRPEQGVSVHAQVIESLLAGDTLWRPNLLPAGELIIGLALGVSVVLLRGRVAPGAQVLLLALAGLLLIAVSWLAFISTGLLLDWTFPVAAVVLTEIAALTAQVRAEVIARRQRERELEAALLQAEAADRAKTEFLAHVSHELRTPLSAIIGFSEVMEKQILGPLAPSYLGYVRDIYASGVHLLGIIQDMLDLAVLDLGGARPSDDSIDIAASLGECTRPAALRAEARGVRIVAELAPGVPVLHADARMFRQMVSNLLSNAIKYSPDGQTVTIRAGITEGWLFVSVADRGRGIADADLQKVLTPFGRLQSASLAQEPGIGIGLSLTKSMIELHGGRIEIRSRVGAGTEALLWFPPARLEPARVEKEHRV